MKRFIGKIFGSEPTDKPFSTDSLMSSTKTSSSSRDDTAFSLSHLPRKKRAKQELTDDSSGMWSLLSEDVLAEIFLFVPTEHLCSLLRLNSAIHDVVDAEHQWRRVFKQITDGEEKIDDSVDWKSNCILAFRNAWTTEIDGVQGPAIEVTNYGRSVRFINNPSGYPLAYMKRKIATKGVMRVDFAMSATAANHLSGNYVIFGVASDEFLKKTMNTTTYVGYTAGMCNIGYANNGYVGQDSRYNVQSDLSFMETAKISMVINANHQRLEAKGSDWTTPFGEIWFYKDGVRDPRLHLTGVFRNPNESIHITVQYSNNNTSEMTTIVEKMSYGDHLLQN